MRKSRRTVVGDLEPAYAAIIQFFWFSVNFIFWFAAFSIRWKCNYSKTRWKWNTCIRLKKINSQERKGSWNGIPTERATCSSFFFFNITSQDYHVELLLTFFLSFKDSIYINVFCLNIISLQKCSNLRFWEFLVLVLVYFSAC